MNEYIIIILCFIIFSIIIRLYNNWLFKKYGINFGCYDIANRELFSIYNIKACLWNLSHIIIFFILCILINAKYNIYKHIFVLTIGILWYILSPYYKNTKEVKCDINIKYVYTDTNKPRKDDIIFNIIGQILYLLYIYL